MILSTSIILWSFLLFCLSLVHLLGSISHIVRNGPFTRWWYLGAGSIQVGLSVMLLGAVSLFKSVQTDLMIVAIILIITGFLSYGLDAFSTRKMLFFNIKGNRTAEENSPRNKDMEIIFQHMKELVMVMDYRGVVVHVNHLGQLDELCPNCKRFIDLIGFLGTDSLKNHLSNLNKATTFPFSSFLFDVQHPYNLKHYQVALEPISNGNAILGYSAFIADISEIVAYTQQIEASNLALAHANQQLERHVQVESKLAEERSKLAMLTEIQKSLIKDIESHAALVHSIAKDFDHVEDITVIQRAFQNLAVNIRNTYQIVRDAVKQMAK